MTSTSSADTVDPERPSTLAIIRKTMACLPGYGPVTALLGALGIAASLAESVGITLLILFVYVSMGVADKGIVGTGSFEEILGYVAGLSASAHNLIPLFLALVIIAKSLLTLANALLGNRIGHGVSEEVRGRLFDRLFDLPYFEIGRLDRGQVLSLLATESFALAAAHNSFVRMIVNIGAAVIFGIFLLFTAWQVAVIAAIGAVLHGVAMKAFSRSIERLGKQALETNRTMTGVMLASLQGMRTYRAFALEQRQKGYFAVVSGAVTAALVRAERVNLVVTPISEFLTLIMLVAVMVAAAPLGVPFSSLLAATLLIYRLQPHLRELESQRLKLHELSASIDRIAAFLADDDGAITTAGDTPVAALEREIRFDGVGLTYPGSSRESLSDIHFRIPAGSRTAIVGPSGAGKTSIVSLILRLIEPTTGRILVDGVDLRSLRREEWLGHVAVAGQDVELVDGNVWDNVALARDTASSDDVEQAVRMAGLEEFVQSLPEGFAEWIGDYGLNVSGGQRQRIGLARALIADRPILILDEATSALDGAIENRIRRNIWRHTRNRTLILITHKLASISGMDHVVCLDDAGHVVEEGDPRILLADPTSRLRRMTDEADVGDPGDQDQID